MLVKVRNYYVGGGKNLIFFVYIFTMFETQEYEVNRESVKECVIKRNDEEGRT